MKTVNVYLRQIFAALICAVSVASTASYAHNGKEAEGGAALSNPVQYVKFDVKPTAQGKVEYTNFTYALPGTNVWNVSTWTDFDVTVQGDPNTYHHTALINPALVALSNSKSSFFGTGTSVARAASMDGDWTVSGKVDDKHIQFTLTYTTAMGPLAGYTFTGTGTIKHDGSMEGTGVDTLNEPGLKWKAPAGSAFEVLNFKTNSTCVRIPNNNNTAYIGLTIPNLTGFVYAGLPLSIEVTENPDTWSHGLTSGSASSPCDGTSPLLNYPVTSGEMEVDSF